jgi:hypothetical protein
METTFVPGAEESYLATDQLAERWSCHIKTVQRRAKRLGVVPLLLGGAVLYPLSEVIRVRTQGSRSLCAAHHREAAANGRKEMGAQKQPRKAIAS